MLTWLEEMAIHIVMGLLHQFVKNPGKKSALQTILFGVADDIYVSYGIVPPAHP